MKSSHKSAQNTGLLFLRCLMRIFEDGEWDVFEEKLNKAVPVYKEMPLFDQYENPSNDASKLLH